MSRGWRRTREPKDGGGGKRGIPQGRNGEEVVTEVKMQGPNPISARFTNRIKNSVVELAGDPRIDEVLFSPILFNSTCQIHIYLLFFFS